VHWADRFVADCASWTEFWERSKKLPNGKTGVLFDASPNSICKLRQSTKLNFGTFGHFAKCHRIFENG
jgi:hypothetical protein